MVTRRVLERRAFLKPNRWVRQLMGYLLAVGCARYDIGLLAATVMSNHVHLVVEDRGGRLPAFMGWLDGFVARAVNRRRGRSDRFWDGKQFHAEALLDEAAVARAIAYVLANPVAAGAVATARTWPGLWTGPAACARAPEVFARPTFFFGRGWPETAALVVQTPQALAHDAARAAGILGALLDQREEALRAAATKEKRRFGSRESALAIDWDTSPSPRSRGPGSDDGERTQATRPRPLARGASALVESFVERVLAFRRAYRVALDDFRGGGIASAFPPGTWLMRLTVPWLLVAAEAPG
ncbi:MAG: transposase [Myxococcota bacterium]